jgi:hypothetical protein
VRPHSADREAVAERLPLLNETTCVPCAFDTVASVSLNFAKPEIKMSIRQRYCDNR